MHTHTYNKLFTIFEWKTSLAEHLLVEEVLMTEYIKYIYTAEA